MKTKNINTAEYYCLQGENQFFDRKSQGKKICKNSGRKRKG
ncbi:hypothetical protein [Anaerococcus vaginalis]|nr:hypothetical protein [Anaerococcus vaginalis]